MENDKRTELFEELYDIIKHPEYSELTIFDVLGVLEAVKHEVLSMADILAIADYPLRIDKDVLDET